MTDASPSATSTPLAGVRVVEIQALGPVPFAAMLLADLGAQVIRITRSDAQRPDFLPKQGAIDRNRAGSIAVDLKTDQGRAQALDLISSADVLVEGFRPGVMERLGLGPDVCLTRNPGLVYARMTGWGQSGPWAGRAGHDINYLSLTGALHAIGNRGRAPVPPLSLLGDYGGGGMLLVVGVLAAVLASRSSGSGRVVDAAIVDGVSLLMNSIWSRYAEGSWIDARGENLLDGGAPYYGVYETLDGRYVAVGALEPKFFRNLVTILGLAERWGNVDQTDRSCWPDLRADLAHALRQKTRDEWSEVFASSDACVTPVLSLSEAPGHPHNRARGIHLNSGGLLQAAPAPRFLAPSPASGRKQELAG